MRWVCVKVLGWLNLVDEAVFVTDYIRNDTHGRYSCIFLFTEGEVVSVTAIKVLRSKHPTRSVHVSVLFYLQQKPLLMFIKKTHQHSNYDCASQSGLHLFLKAIA